MTEKEFVRRWPDDCPKSEASLFVQKLRGSKYPLTNKQIAEILKAIDETCSHCWDAPAGCRCWDDS